MSEYADEWNPSSPLYAVWLTDFGVWLRPVYDTGNPFMVYITEKDAHDAGEYNNEAYETGSFQVCQINGLYKQTPRLVS